MVKVTAGAAYKELKRSDNYVADQINAGADRLAKQGMQQVEINAAKEARAEKRLDEALSGITVDTDALLAKATGFEGRDDVARDLANTATQRSMKYAELARDAAAKGDWVTMNNYKGKISRIKGDFKNTVNDEAILKESMDKYRAAWQTGDIDDDDWLDFGEAMEKSNYEITLDENDNKVIRAIVMDDEGKPEMGEDGKPKVIEKKWSDVVSQRDRPMEVVQLEDKGTQKGLISDMLATMGKRKYDETGQYITTSQTWDEAAEQQFMSKVKGLQANDRTMYSLLKQASGGSITKKKDFTTEDKKMVEDFLRFQVKGGYGEEESMKVRTKTVQEQEKEEAANRALTKRGQDLAEGRAEKQLELDWYKAMNPTETGKEASKSSNLSKLHQDAIDYVDGKTQVAQGGDIITIDKKDYTVKEVNRPKGADYTAIQLVDEKGKTITKKVPNTKRGFLEFKLLGESYKDLSPESILNAKPVIYQELTPQQEVDINDTYKTKYLNANGKFNGNDTEFIADFRRLYGFSDKEMKEVKAVFENNNIEIKGKEFDLDDSDVMTQITGYMKSQGMLKGEAGSDTEDADPLGLGI